MGIKGLTAFIQNNYKWEAANLEQNNKLIIDGLNICCKLYNNNLSCNFGGEYHQFDQIIEKFFKKIRQDCEPIVIFYGIQINNRLPKVRDRRLQSFKLMRNVQTGSTGDRQSHEIKLNMLKPVCMDVLRRLEIKFYVATAEPHKAIAAFANREGCPVLSSDSDYFIFDLKHGLIHFDRYFEGKESLFIRKQFMEQFSLKGDQMLIIPGEFGTNNYFNKSSFDNLTRSYETFRKYYEKYDVTVHHIYENIKRFYCDLEVPFGFPYGGASVDTRLDVSFIRKFSEGLFPPFLVAMYHDKYYLLPTMVEVITKDSAWLISREIRRYLYGLLGPAPVMENIRESYVPKLIEESVHPKFLQPALNIDNFPFSDLDENKRQLIVESVLVPLGISSSEDFKQLDAKWKLPIAATSYWYRHLDVPMPIVMSLLKSFLTCSGIIRRPEPQPDPIARLNSKYQQALHAFAQWQCVYHDAMALNYVACEPFPTTSIASLYSGQVAMCYVLGYQNVDGAIDAASAEGKLYKRLLDLITASEMRQIVTSSDGQGDIQQAHQGQQAHRELLSC